MKKILYLFLIIFSSLSIISCSNDDDSVNSINKSYIKAVINGRTVEFKNVSVTKRTFTNYPDVYDFIAKNENDPTEYIEISITDNNEIGDDVVFGDLEYWKGDKNYNQITRPMYYNVTVNTNNRIEGTFRGISDGNSQEDFVEFTNSEFKFFNYK